jgi:serine protease Do
MNRETREKTGEDELPYLGITGQDVTSNVASVYGLPEGIYIADVAEDTPASEAGLKQGMIIVKFDGETVRSMVELQDLISYYQAGEEITVTVAQQNGEGGYEDTEITVTLGLRSDYTS